MGLACWRDREAVMSASKVDEARKVNVLLIGERPLLFSFWGSALEKAGCQCHFAESHQEMGKVLSHTELDIALSLNAPQSLSGAMAVPAGPPVTMLHRERVAERRCCVPA